jgi:hypothetical protein
LDVHHPYPRAAGDGGTLLPRSGAARFHHRGGHTLNVASSAISRQIAWLEAELDTPLFERVSRGMRPNAAGELLAAHACAAAGSRAHRQ